MAQFSVQTAVAGLASGYNAAMTETELQLQHIGDILAAIPMPDSHPDEQDDQKIGDYCQLGGSIDRPELKFSIPVRDIASQIKTSLISRLPEHNILTKDQLYVSWDIPRAKTQDKHHSRAEIANIVAVSSAKGGVGKSTISVNLALALAGQGARVGLLDADIYGPSQQLMLGIGEDQRPKTSPPNRILPIEAHGIQSISMGYLLGAKQPVVWRGPMVSGALQQLLDQTEWKSLDYLIVDMPPGTGDIQLTLAQKVPVSGALIVTTPERLAVSDARRCAEMYRKVGVTLLGVVENMGQYICPHCGASEKIFGSAGGQRLAADLDLPLLGCLPLQPDIGRYGEEGTPVVVADPQHSASIEFSSIARRLAMNLARAPSESNSKLNLVDITDAMK